MTEFPSNWTQVASNNLTVIARDAVRTAREEPGYDVNPLYGNLRCGWRANPATTSSHSVSQAGA